MVNTKNKYTLVNSGDWQGLYKNEELALEDHRINLEDAFNEVVSSGGITQFVKRDCSYEWINDLGRFPQLLSDVKFLDD